MVSDTTKTDYFYLQHNKQTTNLVACFCVNFLQRSFWKHASAGPQSHKSEFARHFKADHGTNVGGSAAIAFPVSFVVVFVCWVWGQIQVFDILKTRQMVMWGWKFLRFLPSILWCGAHFLAFVPGSRDSQLGIFCCRACLSHTWRLEIEESVEWLHSIAIERSVRSLCLSVKN